MSLNLWIPAKITYLLSQNHQARLENTPEFVSTKLGVKAPCVDSEVCGLFYFIVINNRDTVSVDFLKM